MLFFHAITMNIKRNSSIIFFSASMAGAAFDCGGNIRGKQWILVLNI